MTYLDRSAVAAAVRFTTPLSPVADLPALVLSATADLFGFTVEEVIGRGRSKRLTDARRVALVVMRMNTRLSLEEMGRMFDGRDHTTVREGIERALTSPVVKGWAAAVDAEVATRVGRANAHSLNGAAQDSLKATTMASGERPASPSPPYSPLIEPGVSDD